MERICSRMCHSTKDPVASDHTGTVKCLKAASWGGGGLPARFGMVNPHALPVAGGILY